MHDAWGYLAENGIILTTASGGIVALFSVLAGVWRRHQMRLVVDGKGEKFIIRLEVSKRKNQ